MDEQTNNNKRCISSDTLNYGTIACVTIIFFGTFFILAECNIPEYVSTYPSAVPGAIIVAFTIAMITSLLARKITRAMVTVEKSTEKSSKISVFALVTASLLILTMCMAASCSGDGRDTDSGYSSLSEEEKGRRAVEEEVSHYSYDKFGHLQDDRD